MGGCRSILLGRHTFEMFAPAWSQRTASDDPGAPFMNDSPKYVVARTSPPVEWRNSTMIGPYDAAAIGRLKEEVDGGIYVSGSGTLVRAMLRDGQVDELHLFVFPIVVGSGPRLFADGASSKLELTACEAYTSGAVRLSIGWHHEGERGVVSDTRRIGPGVPGLEIAIVGRQNGDYYESAHRGANNSF